MTALQIKFVSDDDGSDAERDILHGGLLAVVEQLHSIAIALDERNRLHEGRSAPLGNVGTATPEGESETP